MGKDQAVIAVIGGLSQSQAAKMTSKITKAKSIYAPGKRATIVSGPQEYIGSYLQDGCKRLGK